MQCLNESSRNYVRNCWLAAIAGHQGNAPSNISREGPTGVKGAGGTGGHKRAWLRCPWAVAGPGQAAHRHPDRLEAAARPAGPGRTTSRRAERSSRRGRRAGGQAARRPEICRGNNQQLAARTARGREAAHGRIKQPGLMQRPEHPWGNKQHHKGTHNDTRPRPVSRPRPRHAHAAPFTTAPPAIRRSCPRGPRPRRGQPRGGRRGRGTGSRTRSRRPRCGRSGSTAGRHRARHTRRA